MNIGILTIATGKYIKYVNPLWESVKKHFLKSHNVTMFVFTDSEDFTPENGQIKIHQKHIPWPGPTLFRYNIFNSNKNALKNMDYLFYCDADMLFVDDVGDEIFGNLVGTIHPGFYNKPREYFTYETNPKSKAYVPSNEGSIYYAGGFNGGTSNAYLKMAEVLSERVLEDRKNGIIAIWHDESHLNRYFIENKPDKILNPDYCYPESWNIPFSKKLLALDKNHEEMRK